MNIRINKKENLISLPFSFFYIKASFISASKYTATFKIELEGAPSDEKVLCIPFNNCLAYAECRLSIPEHLRLRFIQ